MSTLADNDTKQHSNEDDDNYNTDCHDPRLTWSRSRSWYRWLTIWLRCK